MWIVITAFVTAIVAIDMTGIPLGNGVISDPMAQHLITQPETYVRSHVVR